MTQTRRLRRALLVGSAVLLLAGAAVADTSPRVKFQTSAGDFTVELYPDKAPKSVDNFLQYVAEQFYNGTIFHRVIAGFMIQGGGMTADMKEKATRGPIPLEAANGLKNDRGTLAMARTRDPNSATAQFFINVVDNGFLNYTAPTPQGSGYTVFGKVIAGMDVIDKIRLVPTATVSRYENVPATPIVINSATLVK
jgi:peptidyl-prolyl cis-trans isomerase A (cyclophilin A)